MYFLGVDIGSSYTKLTVSDQEGKPLCNHVIRTFNRNKHQLENLLTELNAQFEIVQTCATGYGRNHLKSEHISKTEIYCAAMGVSALAGKDSTILDIGGEDIKVIRASADGKVIDFYMNSKCAAGTGTFITEIAERAEINLKEMSELASQSASTIELNSFCTVFAKTEIMKWIFEDMPVADMARGIYLSIVNRIAKLKIDRQLPLYVIGGVVAHHPYLKTVLEEKFAREIFIPANPQTINSFGAALLARKEWMLNKDQQPAA